MLPVSVSRVVYVWWTWPRTSIFVARRWQTWFARSNFENLHESLGNQGTHSVHYPQHIHRRWTVGSDMSLPTVLQKLYSSRKLFVQLLLQLLLRRLKLLGRLLLFNITVFVRILGSLNHLLSLWSTILQWQTACWLFVKTSMPQK